MVSRADLSANAEAAAWIARLQSPARTDATEAALKAWLHADPANEAAFERATEVWTMIPGAALCRASEEAVRRPTRAPVAHRRPVPHRPLLALAASILLLVTVGAGWWALSGPDGYSTRVGEQKVATLEDGSRIALNTDTEVEVRYAPDMRRIRLDRGEAIFEVAHNPARPFIVEADGRQIRALGTRFVVRRSADGVAVTLIEGKVSITDTRPAKPADAHATILAPGERLTVSATQPSTIDRPAIESVTAWRRGQVIFSDTPLSAAVAEMNRYGGPTIALDDPRLASLRVSGVFATNETQEFASAVAALHALRLQRSAQEIRIVR